MVVADLPAQPTIADGDADVERMSLVANNANIVQFYLIRYVVIVLFIFILTI